MLKFFLVLLFVTSVVSQPLEGTTIKFPDLSEIYHGLVELVKKLLAYIPFVIPVIPSNATNFSPPSHKILITGGWPYRLGQKTSIIDTGNDDFDCTLPDFPIEMQSGVGGLVEGNVPLVCGGLNGTGLIPDCFQLTRSGWKQAGMLDKGRFGMGVGIVFDQKLLINGGLDGPSVSDSTVLVDTLSTESIEDLPLGLQGHCNIMLNSSHYMVTGRIDQANDRRPETRIFDLIKKEWSMGPSMQRPKYAHGCVRMILGGKQIVWVTGGFDNSKRYSEYLEIDQLNQGWKSGPNLPYPLTNHRMVASEDLKNVYITSSDGNILEIQCSGSTPDTCAFKPLASSIRTKQGPHIAFTISDSLADSLCE